MAVLKPKKTFDPKYIKNFNEAEMDKERVWEITAVCKRIKDNKARYMQISKETGVPWDIIACIHYRESSLSFAGVLHNGEKIIGTNKKTKLVPAGKGPFKTWEEAAVDALLMKKRIFPAEWTIETELAFLERFNGLGYRNRGELSPYIWAGTNKHDETGKYVADGKYSATAKEKQLGCVSILKTLRKA
jgi:lysozyme family protein